jgi:hypothetical protein
MALNHDELALLASMLDDAADARAAVAAVRTRWPQLGVCLQDAFDLRGETPALHSAAFDVHLMANDGACWRMTADPQAAAAIVLVDRHD